MISFNEEAWIEHLVPTEEGSSFGPGWRQWAHEVFLLRGPIEAEEVEALARSVVQDRAQQACVLVAADVLSTLGDTIALSTPIDERTVRIVVDGQIASATGLHSVGQEDLIMEVADAVQAEIIGNRRAWPECPHHDAGLHAELDKGKAVWNCRVGGHRVEAIGYLTGAARLSTGATSTALGDFDRRNSSSRRRQRKDRSGRWDTPPQVAQPPSAWSY